MTDLVNLGFKANTTGLVNAQTQLNKTTAAGGRLDKQMSVTERSLGAVGTAIVAVGAAVSINQIIRYSDEWSNLNAQLKQVTNSESDLLKLRKELLDVSIDTRISLSSTINLYSEITRSTSELGVSSEKIVGITKTLNNLFLAGGKPISEVSGAIRQLNQGFASGVLRGDEFNSVAEGAPRIMDALSLSLGMTRGELREFAATGGITAEIMIDAIDSFSEQAQRMADTVELTFSQSVVVATNNMTKFVGESEAVTATVGALGDSLVFISENITSVSYAIGGAGAALASAYGTKLILSIAATTGATIDQVKANNAELVSQAELIASTAKLDQQRLSSSAINEAAAAKEKALSVSRLKDAIAAIEAEAALEQSRLKAQISTQGRIASGLRLSEINASRNVLNKQLSASETELAAATSRVTAAELAATNGKVRLAAANSALDKSIKKTTVSATALGAATKFMLGPWGLLITTLGVGAAAFATASSKMDEATKRADKHAESVAKLEKIYSGANFERIAADYIKVQNKAIEIAEKRIQLENKLNEVSQQASAASSNQTNQFSGISESIKFANEAASIAKEIEDLNKKEKKLNKTLSTLSGILDNNIDKMKGFKEPTENTSVAFGGLSDEVLRLIDSLDPAAAKLNEFNKNYDLIIGSLSDGLVSYEETIRLLGLLEESYNDSFETDPLQGILKSLDDQILSLEMGADAYEIYAAKVEAIDAGISDSDSLSAIEERVKRIQDLRAEADNISDITKDIEDFGGAWSRTGNVIVDAFGDMSDAIQDYAKRMGNIEDIQSKIDDATIAAGKDKEKLAEISVLQSKLNEEQVSAELSGYRSLAQGSASLFSEKTAAAKAFNAINQVLAAAEIALSYQKITAGTAETATHVKNETLKQNSNAFTAITSAFAAPFPINFVAGAAMIGIMASLLGSSFGGGGGSSPSSTGTALGGGDSQSIDNINEDLEDIMIDQLAELRGLRSDLTSVDNQAYSLLTQLLRVDPDSTEIRNATEADLERSFAGLNTGGRSTGSYTSELESIFSSVNSAIAESLDILDTDTRRNISDFVFNVGTISFDELDAEEAQERLGEIISSQSDLLTEFLIPSITQYQQVGEGAFETLVRVAREQTIFNDSIDQLSISLEGLSSAVQTDISQNLINLVGGVENFSDFIEEFTDEFLTDAQRLTNLENSLSDVFDDVGLSLVTTREDFAALVAGVDITSEAGQELLATLLEISPAMAEYIGALEDLADDKLSLQIELLEEQGLAEEALALSRQRELEGLDESLRALQLQIYAQEDLNEQRELEIERIDEQRDAYNELIDDLESAVSSAATNLNNSLDAELSRYDELIAQSQSAAAAEIEAIQSASTARIESLNEERSIVASVASALGEASMQFTATQALAAARSGDFSLANNISTPSSFSSATDERVSLARQAFALNEIGKLADQELSDIDRTISASERSAQQQVDAIQLASDQEVEQLEQARLEVENQIKAILGVDESVLSLEQATAEYQVAQDRLQEELAKNTLEMLQQQEDVALLAYDQARNDAQMQIDAQYVTVDVLNEIRSTVEDISVQPVYTPPESANDEIVGELRALREDLDNANQQIGENTKKTADSVRSLTYLQQEIA